MNGYQPKPLYDCSIHYHTPSGKLVCYGALLAMHKGESLQDRLEAMLRYEKRRKVASVAYDSFAATYRTMQIGKPMMAGETRHPMPYDARYRVGLVHRGRATPDHVAYFCDEAIGWHESFDGACKLAFDHAAMFREA